MNAEQAITLVAETLGVQPVSAMLQTFGHNSVTYEVVLPGRSVMVRMNAQAQVFATTQNNLAVLAGLGLPTPKVLAVDLSRSRVPFASMILEKIPGRDLRYELGAMSFEQMTLLATQIVGFQRQVGLRLPPGRGYGYVGIGETGLYDSWGDVVEHESAKGDAPGNDDDGNRLRRMRVRSLRQRFEPYLCAVPPTCFLDDITVKNVIVLDGVLQGLVDFDCVCYGDPLFWLALTATGIVSDVGTRGLFYVEELKRLWGLTPEQESVLALYSAGMALDFLRRSASTESPEWKVRMQAACDEWITLAERSNPFSEIGDIR